MFNLYLDYTAECVKTLADNNRCVTCDNLNTPCVRYPCGHSACEECVKVAECCLLCITPPSKIIHFNDEPQSLRVQHVAELVLAFQDLYGLDVNRRSSTSKHLKLEKLVFPECIQAPNKYYNKRKSSNSFCKGKENKKPKIVIPGEEVSTTGHKKMESKNNYVQQWLSNIDSPVCSKKLPRKPFTDLSVNNNQEQCFTKESQQSFRKRKHFKTMISSSTENHEIPMKKRKSGFSVKNKASKIKQNVKKYKQKKGEADESGIVIDDEVIEIMDSQLENYDKDILACKAIEQAELNNDEACLDCFNDSSYIDKTLPNVCILPAKNIPCKVPFYKKSCLYNTCCASHTDFNDEQNNKKDFKNVTIVVDSKSFNTTINISNCKDNVDCTIDKGYSKVNKLNVEYDPFLKHNEQKLSDILKKEQTKNAPLPMDVKHNLLEKENYFKTGYNGEGLADVRKSVVINDSDTDSNLSSTDKDKEVIVEVHRSCDETDYGVLSTLDHDLTVNRSRHARREQTPGSTDSSDKENYDPNRMKITKHDKKCRQKK